MTAHDRSINARAGAHEIEHTARNGIPRVILLDAGACRAAKALSQDIVVVQPQHCSRECSAVTGRAEQAILAILNQCRQLSDAANHHGQPGRHVLIDFERREVKPLRLRIGRGRNVKLRH
jgi:hypothetical protein